MEKYLKYQKRIEELLILDSIGSTYLISILSELSKQNEHSDQEKIDKCKVLVMDYISERYNLMLLFPKLDIEGICNLTKPFHPEFDHL